MFGEDEPFNFTSSPDQSQALTFAELRKTIETLTDRQPAIVSALKMSAQTLNELIHQANARQVKIGDSPLYGMKIAIDHDMPFCEWEEWFDGAWRNPDPLLR